MHIRVHTLTGNKCEFTADKSVDIKLINEQILSQIGVPVESQKVLLNGKVLDSSSNISELISESEDLNLYLVVELQGGVKGKKKKKMVKKNKKPHKHRKNKLGILNYYKVENGSVVRLKQQCKICPPGKNKI